ncbi:hypothetical protein CAQUA_10810 [Corynebacterium aquatimens]|nr:hypothetical protein CAQUA_10810 [Corynebacterium aquatimens]
MGLRKNDYGALLGGVVDKRDPAFRALMKKGMKPGTFVTVAGPYVCEHAAYKALRPYEKHWLRAFLRGKLAKKSIVMGKSAARLLGMPLILRSEEMVEFVTRATGHPQPPRGCVYRRASIEDHEITTVHGIAVTTPARTAIDIARYHGFADGLVAMDAFLREFGTREELEATLASMPRFKNKRLARSCIAFADADAQSAVESFARAALIEAGITGVSLQFPVEIYFVDLCIDGWLLIEIDGAVKYEEDTREALLRERQREKRILNLGYRMLRFSAKEIIAHPQGFVREVLKALGSRHT